MRVVILGAKGMLGKDLGGVFYDHSPYLLDKDELNITDKPSVQAVFKHLRPQVVINAAAYTDVDGCETNQDLAMLVNGYAPEYLANAARDAGAIFVHYSTDYVFSGVQKDGYKEQDPPGPPVNFYGMSKLHGERAIQEAGGNYYIIRTSWLFGAHGKNFVETMLRLASAQEKIRVVNDQHGKPTFSLDLARKTRKLIEDKSDFGIYHITNEPKGTWYDFACAILRRGLNPLQSSSSPGISPCTSSEFPRPAKRPAYSVLLNTKLPPLRSWEEALEEYLARRVA